MPAKRQVVVDVCLYKIAGVSRRYLLNYQLYNMHYISLRMNQLRNLDILHL